MDYIDTKEAAKRWSVSESYVRKLIKQQRVRAKKVRRDWLVDAASLEQYMQSPRKPGPKPLDN